MLTPLLLAVSVKWGRVGVGIAFNQNCSSFTLQKFDRTDEMCTAQHRFRHLDRNAERNQSGCHKVNRFRHLDRNTERNQSGCYNVIRCQQVSTLHDRNRIPESSTQHQEFYDQTRSTPAGSASQLRDQTRSSAIQTGHPDQSHRRIHL